MVAAANDAAPCRQHGQQLTMVEAMLPHSLSCICMPRAQAMVVDGSDQTRLLLSHHHRHAIGFEMEFLLVCVLISPLTTTLLQCQEFDCVCVCKQESRADQGGGKTTASIAQRVMPNTFS